MNSILCKSLLVRRHLISKLVLRGKATARTGHEKEIEFKRVTEADYDAIMAIRTNYNIDLYLPTRFHKMILSHRGYAAFVNNEMVGFHFGAIIDDGTSLLLQAARVRKDFEGKGIFTRLYNHITEQMKQENDRVVRSIAAAASAKVYHLCTRKGARIAFERKYIQGLVPMQLLQRYIDGAETRNTSLKTLYKNDIKVLLQNKYFQDEYLSNQRIVIDFVPYRPMETNLDFYSFEDVHCLMSTKAAMLSFSSIYDYGNRQHVWINFSGRSKDPSEIRNHISEHLRFHLHFNSTTFMLLISSDSFFDMENLKRALEIHLRTDTMIYGILPLLETPLK